MKHLKKIDLIKESKKEGIILDFEKALKTGNSSVNLDYYSREWGKVTKEYHLYDNYYLYKDTIFILNTRPSGDWYHSELVKSEKQPHIFEEELRDKIEDLQNALDKLRFN